MGIEWWASTMLARSFVAALGKAQNYVVQKFALVIPSGTPTPIEVTIQRVGKRTPHTARLEAEAEVARLRALLAEHGIEAGGPREFSPDAPPPLTLEGPSRPAKSVPPASPTVPWVRVIASNPTVYACTRCGRTERMVGEGEAETAQAILVFQAAHAACEDAQTTLGAPHRD